MSGGTLAKFSAALVWPVLALVFAAIFASLWRFDRSRKHLLQFALGFLALFFAMSFHIAFVSLNTAAAVAVAHGLASLSIVAIIWGASSRLGQRTPLFPMVVVSAVSATLLYFALSSGKDSVALSVQNAASGLLFAIGSVLLWMARPSGLLDWVLIWTMGAIAALGLTRPAILILLEVDVGPLVERQSDFSVAGLIVMTVLTVILGLSLVALAIREGLEIRLSARNAEAISGFLDQRAFGLSCDSSLAIARNLRMPACLALVQLDWFYAVTEKWGAHSSDALVRQVADVVRAAQREGDVLGRVGEDRFGIFFVGASSQSGLKVAGALRAAVDRSCNETFGVGMKFTTSISLAETKGGMKFDELYVLAARPRT